MFSKVHTFGCGLFGCNSLSILYNKSIQEIPMIQEEIHVNEIAKKIEKTVHNVVGAVVNNVLAQNENTASGERVVTAGMPELIRKSGAEGIVMLKNEGEALPLKDSDKVSVFGRCQNDWFYVGYGSGGDVHAPYYVSLMEGLENAGVQVNQKLAAIYRDWCARKENQADHGWWGHWPYFHEEMPLEEDVVREAAADSNVAIIVIGRAAGEDRENILEAGSYYLTEKEHKMLQLVGQHFSKVVLLMDCGNVMDLSFVKRYNISALLFVWQLGMESGNAIADVLTGKVNVSGKLSDTIARSYTDYPSSAHFGNREYNEYTEDIYVGYRYFETFAKDKILYPFGFGLSYTTFSMETVGFERGSGETVLRICVTNTGSVSGKEIAQVYCVPPAGKLGKARKNLVAYGKTKLLAPGESQILSLTVRDYDCASFDDCGATGYKDAFVLEEGSYQLLAGNCSTTETVAGSFTVGETVKLLQCSESCIPDPDHPFKVLHPDGSREVNMGSRSLKQRILDNLPETIPYAGNQGILLEDVLHGEATLEQFVAQLTDKDLSDICKGEGGMDSSLGTSGNAGAYGGITPELRQKGIPPIITADGPSGLRVNRFTSLLPVGTALACSWNDELIEALYEGVGKETRGYGVDVILSPGMNIHRNPLCGRNFEYYSEDPLLCGKMAAAAVRGIQKGGTSACPKHFACNNQEVNRSGNDSRVSMRALREIYLKCFEICVKEARPMHIMTSYNKINGVWSHYNYDLVTTILRGEWGFEGNVITDWWMRKTTSPEFPKLKNSAYRVRAQVDVLMPGGDNYADNKYRFDSEILETVDKPEGLTRGELQRSAMNVLRFALIRMAMKEERGA